MINSLFLRRYRLASEGAEQEELLSLTLTVTASQHQHQNNLEVEAGADRVAEGGVAGKEAVAVRGREQKAKQRRVMGCLQMTSNTAQMNLIGTTMKKMYQILIHHYPLEQSLVATSLNLHNSSQQYLVQLVAQRRKDHTEEIQSQHYAKHVIEVTAPQTTKWCFATAVVARIINIAIIHQ